MCRENIASVGNHFLIGLRPSPVLDDRDRALLADLRPAGVILFKSNFRHDLPYEAWLASHARLIADLRAATGRARLFIAIDHEGGRVCRTPPPVTRFAYAARWAGQAARVGPSPVLSIIFYDSVFTRIFVMDKFFYFYALLK
ncbi:MAG: hypothetical protein ACREDM_14570 [Methylocella sp.]